jgi:hypothetical protein
MKRCSKCQCEKPLSEFYKNSTMRGGLVGKCKECTCDDVKKNRLENLERVRAYDRMRSSMPQRVAARNKYQQAANWKQIHAAAVLRWAQKHPDRRKASHIVSNALRGGKLKRQPCWSCGEKAQAHHPDYSRPLDVVWLCTSHHAAAHKLTNQLHRDHHHANHN